MRYRATYIRKGFPRSVTFWANDLVEMTEFVEIWEEMTGCPVLTCQPDKGK